MTAPKILIVEDDRGHQRLIRLNLSREKLSLDVETFGDGQAVLDYLTAEGKEAVEGADQPLFILLDLRLPKVDGVDVLRHVKAHPHLRRIPVTVFTTSDDPGTIATCYDLGCSYYFIKPSDYEKFSEVVAEIGRVASLARLPSLA